MPKVEELLSRIDKEFSAVEDRIKKNQSQQVDVFRGRQDRLAKFEQTLDHLRDVWRPRLEAFAKRFGDRVKVTPSTDPTKRAATYELQTDLAQVQLRLSAMTDQEVKQVILNYDLQILPILMKYENHAELALPLDAVDDETVAMWIDDRLVQFVQTYLSLHENQYYLKPHMVEDPIARVQFPKFAAGAKLELEGKTHYFIGEETLRAFQERNVAKK
jgi:YHS domain-containing protein